MKIFRITGCIVLSLFAVFAVATCGGGGGGSSPPPGPTVTTAPATGVGIDNAGLNGTVNPNGLATQYWFEWGTSSTLATFDNTAAKSAGAGVANVAASDTITGLTLSTTYYYRLAASNSAGTIKGSIVPFTTASPMDPPTVQTNATDNITVSGATIHGSVTPNALATTAYFEWGTDNTLAVPSVTPTQSVGSDNSSHPVSAFLPNSSLSVGQTYYYRIVGTNSAGTSKGSTTSFTYTLKPVAVTNAAQPVGTDNAQLNGTVNPNGLATTYHFEWATDNTALANSTPEVSAGSGTADNAVSAVIPGLSEVTTYYFRLVATNSSGTTVGLIRSFTTLATPPPTADAGADQTVYMLGPFGMTEVTLDGTGTPTAGTTIASYQWTQISGPTVTLDNEASPTPAFTVPTISYPPDDNAALQFELAVTDNLGHTGTDNVGVLVKWGFLDDFSVDSTSTYSTELPWGTLGQFSYTGSAAEVTAPAANSLAFEHPLGLAANEAVFSFNYSQSNSFGFGGDLEIRLGEDYNTCYLLSTSLGQIQKWRGGVMVDNVAFAPTFVTGNTYWFKIKFTPAETTVEIHNGGAVQTFEPLTVNDQSVPVTNFRITTIEQNATYDNITLDVVY